MPNSAERGAWRSGTGGAVLHLTPLKATLYSESGHGCLSVLSFPAHMKLVELAEGASVSVVDGQLQLAVDGGLQNLRFDKLDALPKDCTDPNPDTATGKDVFEAVWIAMDENYAFFDLHGVDWAERRALAPNPERQTQMTDAEVSAMLLAMMEGLDDGHVYFGSDTIGYKSPSQSPEWLPAGGKLTRDILRDIATANAGTSLTEVSEAPIFYGLRDDRIGYISIQAMDVRVPFGTNSSDAMAAVFGDVLTKLASAKALVIDIRYNPGGSDTVSFGIAGHFIDTPLPVFTKTTRMGDTQVAPYTAVLLPIDDTPETRPVVLVTSGLTGSAAEILTLAMREMDHVISLGEPTSGGLSDVMEFTLPNGWSLSLSNQTYLSMNGELFEGVGIPPDSSVAFEAPQYLAGRDPVLVAAFAKANELAN